MPNEALLAPHRFNAETQPDHSKGRSSPYGNAVAIQRLILERCQNPKCTDIQLAALARAWDVLEERKRILRGIPLPGQLRPDLDPVQLAKALKRSRARKPIEMQSTAGAFTGPADDGEPETPEKTAKIVVTKTGEKTGEGTTDETKESI